MCKKQFRTKGIRDTGSKEEEADTVYLLAKALPHTLVSDQNDEFKKLLAETEAKDIVAFAQAVGQQAKDIDTKVCDREPARGSNDGDTVEDLWNCRKKHGGGERKFSAQFKTADGEGRGKNWPKKTEANKPSGNIVSGGGSDEVAAALMDLQRHEKSKVASLLSRTISGAEVVEIRAVSSAMAGV